MYKLLADGLPSKQDSLPNKMDWKGEPWNTFNYRAIRFFGFLDAYSFLASYFDAVDSSEVVKNRKF